MKNKMTIDFARLLLGVALVFVLSACQASQPTKPSEQPATVSAADEPVEPWDGDGMDIPLDGSSLEAFNKSLARVKAHTNPSSYTTLVNAIDYLLVYDLSAKRDRTRLAANLDGLTGKQVIDKVSWQKK
jgi:hypothetical protein